MRLGENDKDLTTLEKKAGQAAARKLSRKLKSLLRISNVKRTGLQLKTASARAVMKYGQLDHIAISATSATFIQHYGFEGIKSNGVRMRLKATDIFGKLLNDTRAIEELADEISEIRADEITAKIRF